jgi:hypothetical protein
MHFIFTRKVRAAVQSLLMAIMILCFGGMIACKTTFPDVNQALTKKLSEVQARDEAYGLFDRDLARLNALPESERVKFERAALTRLRDRQKEKLDKFFSRFRPSDQCWSYRTYVVQDRGGQTGLAQVRKGRVKEVLPLLTID